jgi:alkylation response protein AidB-like acyl-CoA dehydrogenase
MPVSPYLDAEAERARAEFRAVVNACIAPQAARADKEGVLPGETLRALRSLKALGATLDAEFGGAGLSAGLYGLLTVEVARGCGAARTLMTVHELTAQTLARFARGALKAEYLPSLARGALLGAVAFSEPDAGTDLAGVSTTVTFKPDCAVVNGAKSWVSAGVIADLFLVLGRSEKGPVAVVLRADAPGLKRTPRPDMVALRGSMMADLEINDCEIPLDHVLAKPGQGISHIAMHALDHGRHSVAWGAAGVAEACLASAMEFARTRTLDGKRLGEHDLARALITRMAVGTRSALLLCWKAGELRDARRPEAILETMIAKYAAVEAANMAARTVQRLHGARGLSSDHPLERWTRDVRALEIIEGSVEALEIVIGAQPALEL